MGKSNIFEFLRKSHVILKMEEMGQVSGNGGSIVISYLLHFALAFRVPSSFFLYFQSRFVFFLLSLVLLYLSSTVSRSFYLSCFLIVFFSFGPYVFPWFGVNSVFTSCINPYKHSLYLDLFLPFITVLFCIVCFATCLALLLRSCLLCFLLCFFCQGLI